MARIRDIKPGFFLNEDLASCSPHARLMFAGLWCIADRAGRLEDRPRRIGAELFPYEPLLDFDALIDELSARDFVVRYEVGGERYIQIAKFAEHQRPHPREAPSTYPDPPSNTKARRGKTKALPSRAYLRGSLGTHGIGVNTGEGESGPASPPLLPDGSAPAPPSIESAVEVWNGEAPTAGLPIIRSISEDDRKAWRARCRDKGFADGIEPAIRKLCASSFARKSKWANFRWLLKNNTNWRKAAEGNYDDGPGDHQQDLRTLGAHTTDEKPPTREEAERKYRTRVEIALTALPAGEVRDRALSDADKFAALNGIEIRREWPRREAS